MSNINSKNEKKMQFEDQGVGREYLEAKNSYENSLLSEFVVNKNFEPSLLDVQTSGRTWVFFTKPYLNISDRDDASDSARKNAFSCDFSTYTKSLKDWLIPNLNTLDPVNSKYGSPFVPLLTNLVKQSSSLIEDESTEAISLVETKTGSTISVSGGSSFKKGKGEFSCIFQEIRGLYITNYYKVLLKYIDQCYKGKINRSVHSRANNYIDFMCSVYVLVTDVDNESIIYWTKYTGVSPLGITMSGISKEGTEMFTPTVSYAYSIRNSLDLFTINEFATLCNSAIDTTTSPDFNTFSFENIRGINTPKNITKPNPFILDDGAFIPKDYKGIEDVDSFTNRNRMLSNQFMNSSPLPYIEVISPSAAEAVSRYKLRFLRQDIAK